MPYVEFDEGEGESRGGNAEAGEYEFKVDEIVEKTFQSGSRGITIKLLAGVGSRDLSVYENVVLTPAQGKQNNRFRLAQLAHAVGFETSKGLDTDKLIGKMGRAWFEPDDRGYLKVAEYRDADTTPPDAARERAREIADSLGGAQERKPDLESVRLKPGNVPF